VINGDLEHALPHMLNVSIPNISSEYVTLALDHAGIAISTKSACREGEESRSHVVAALDGDSLESDWRARNTLRISLGHDTTQKEVSKTINKLAEICTHVHNSLT
jgi:cysteine desulfurase